MTTTDPMDEIERSMRLEIVRSKVQKRITCPLSGKVLDYRRCGVILDADGDPADVFHEDMLERVLGILKTRPGYLAVIAPFQAVRR